MYLIYHDKVFNRYEAFWGELTIYAVIQFDLSLITYCNVIHHI